MIEEITKTFWILTGFMEDIKLKETSSANYEISRMNSLDIKDVARIHLNNFTSSGSFLGIQFLEEKFKWISINDNMIAFVLRHNNRVAGFVYGRHKGYKKKTYKVIFRNMFFIKNPVKVSVFLIIKAKQRVLTLVKRIFGWKKKRQNNINNICAGQIAHIDVLAVGERYRSKGFDSALIKAFEQEAKQKNPLYIYVSTEKNRVSAQKLYEKNGFKRTGKSEYSYYKNISL